jgi:hypothetical protein
MIYQAKTERLAAVRQCVTMDPVFNAPALGTVKCEVGTSLRRTAMLT